jgi:hypothetical protein
MVKTFHMTLRSAILCSAIAVAITTVSAVAHDVTFKGTALSVAAESVGVNVVDPETKKVTPMTFVVDDITKVLRDDVLVKFAAANIKKGENISVTVNHDLDEELAQVIRLGKSK